MIRFAIRVGTQFYNDGHDNGSREGFTSDESKATTWTHREDAQRVVDFWYDNYETSNLAAYEAAKAADPQAKIKPPKKNDTPWYATRDGLSVGKHTRHFDDTTKVTSFPLNETPAHVVEIEREGWPRYMSRFDHGLAAGAKRVEGHPLFAE